MNQSEGPDQESIDPQGPREYNLQRVEPGDYETLTYLLAHAENGDVVIVRNKDRGLDARLPDPVGRTTLRGWQAKRFAKASIHWPQCQRSLDDAVTFWRPLRVTFVFAHDLSAKEQAEFQAELAERHPYVRVDFWGASEVQRRLRDTEEGRRAAAWLFGSGETIEDVLAAMVSKEPVRTPAEIAERQAALQKRLDTDPHFYYSTVARTTGAPETPPATGTLASVVLMIDGQEVRYDLAERYPGSMEDLGGGPLLVASGDESGRQARAIVQQALSATGPTEINSGLGIAWPKIPVGLRGLIPGRPVWGPVQVLPQDDRGGSESAVESGVMPVLARAGEASLGMALTLTDEPREGFDYTMVAATGGLELLYSVRGETPGEMEHILDWRHALGVGSALEQLLSCRMMLAVLNGASLELSPPADRDAVLAGAVAEHTFTDDAIAELGTHERFLTLVCELQAWLGRPLSPPARPTDDDAAELAWALGLIREPQRRGTWREVNVTMIGEAPAEILEVAILEPLYVTLFGSRIYLGIDLIGLPAARIVERDGHDVRLVPADDDTVVVTLQHPDLAPAEAARTRGDAAGHGRVIVRPRQEGDGGEPA